MRMRIDGGQWAERPQEVPKESKRNDSFLDVTVLTSPMRRSRYSRCCLMIQIYPDPGIQKHILRYPDSWTFLGKMMEQYAGAQFSCILVFPARGQTSGFFQDLSRMGCCVTLILHLRPAWRPPFPSFLNLEQMFSRRHPKTKETCDVSWCCSCFHRWAMLSWLNRQKPSVQQTGPRGPHKILLQGFWTQWAQETRLQGGSAIEDLQCIVESFGKRHRCVMRLCNVVPWRSARCVLVGTIGTIGKPLGQSMAKAT